MAEVLCLERIRRRVAERRMQIGCVVVGEPASQRSSPAKMAAGLVPIPPFTQP